MLMFTGFESMITPRASPSRCAIRRCCWWSSMRKGATLLGFFIWWRVWWSDFKTSNRRPAGCFGNVKKIIETVPWNDRWNMKHQNSSLHLEQWTISAQEPYICFLETDPWCLILSSSAGVSELEPFMVEMYKHLQSSRLASQQRYNTSQRRKLPSSLVCLGNVRPL